MIRGFISDVHGNREALLTAIKILEDCAAEEIYFLGDAVGYLPGISALAEIVERGIPSICGNHETMLSGSADLEFNPMYGLERTRAQLTPALAAALADWPTSRDVETSSGPLLLVHGSPRNPTFEYVYPDSPLDGFRVRAGTTVFMGHTHRAFVRTHEQVTYVNVGSCAMPRDTPGLGAVAVHDDNSGRVRLIRFDITAEIASALARLEGVHPNVIAFLQRSKGAGVVGGRDDD